LISASLTNLSNIYIEDPDSDEYADLISATIVILMSKAAMSTRNLDENTEIEISLPEINSALDQYCHEIALEELHRLGFLDYASADLSNIFENRDLKVSNLK